MYLSTRAVTGGQRHLREVEGQVVVLLDTADLLSDLCLESRRTALQPLPSQASDTLLLQV